MHCAVKYGAKLRQISLQQQQQQQQVLVILLLQRSNSKIKAVLIVLVLAVLVVGESLMSVGGRQFLTDNYCKYSLYIHRSLSGSIGLLCICCSCSTVDVA
jgi:hypothetical protein